MLKQHHMHMFGHMLHTPWQPLHEAELKQSLQSWPVARLGVAPASSMYRKFSAYDSRWLGCAAARPLARWYASAAIAGILPVHAQRMSTPAAPSARLRTHLCLW